MKIKAKQLPADSGVINGKIYNVIVKYDKGYLITNDDGAAVKIHRNNCEVINGHPHAELIMKYAEIAQHDAEPWKYFEYYAAVGWVECSPLLAFNETVEYRLKPRTININGFEVPEPLRTAPAYDTPYFIIDIPDTLSLAWSNSHDEKIWLKKGIIHLTREAAEKHIEALLSFTKD